jgi:fatty-acyl-CoA synthase
VRIVDPVSLETVPIGMSGGVVGPRVLHDARLLRHAEKSAETLRADGWLRTGDLATMDERGYCRIVGRLKDMIIRGGENLFPAEIEEAIDRSRVDTSRRADHHAAAAELCL